MGVTVTRNPTASTDATELRNPPVMRKSSLPLFIPDCLISIRAGAFAPWSAALVIARVASLGRAVRACVARDGCGLLLGTAYDWMGYAVRQRATAIGTGTGLGEY